MNAVTGVSPAGAAANESPPRPRCALEVGVVGNRRFGGETDGKADATADEMKARAAEACTEVWRAIEKGMMEALEQPVEVPREFRPRGMTMPEEPLTMSDFFDLPKETAEETGEKTEDEEDKAKEQTPRLGVLSSLAAGADQIGAETALALNASASGVTVELEAVFPFPEEDYPGTSKGLRKEFRKDEAKKLRDLVKQASQVVRLDGAYHADPTIPVGGDKNKEARHRAYRQARNMLLFDSDLVVAVYDPMPPGGAAGTLEAVDEALAQSMPVVAVLVGKEEVRIKNYRTPADRRRKGEEGWAEACPVAASGWRKELRERVKYLMSIPHLRPEKPETESERRERMRLLAETVHRLRIFYGEEKMHSPCRCHFRKRLLPWVWKTMCRIGVRCAPLDLDDRDKSVRERIVSWAKSVPGRTKSWFETEANRVKAWVLSETPEQDDPIDKVTVVPYAAFYDRASDLSAAYMGSG